MIWKLGKTSTYLSVILKWCPPAEIRGIQRFVLIGEFLSDLVSYKETQLPYSIRGIWITMGGRAVYWICWAVIFTTARNSAALCKSIFWIDLQWLVIRYLLFLLVKELAKIRARDAKSSHHHELLPFVCLIWVARNNIVSVWFLGNITQSIYTVSLRTLSSLHYAVL